jgi:hypothetical protein
LNRGIFSSLLDNAAYKTSRKNWSVTLQRTYIHWYDLLVNPNDASDLFDTRKLISDYLKQLKEAVEKNLEKRFVYFICTRKKVRFNKNKNPSYNIFTKRLKIHLLVGKMQEKIVITTRFFDVATSSFSKPEILLTDKYITLTDSRGSKTTLSVHDFLAESETDLGYSSKIEYVGYTKNPHQRPTNGVHAGLNEVLYKVSSDDVDTFIVFNLFKVTANAKNIDFKFNFIVPNSMIDEIQVDLEGQILEKCLILYFDSDNQTKNKDKESGELKQKLIKISKENYINSIHFCYELERQNEYWLFSSSKVQAQHKHIFTVSLVNGTPEIKSGSTFFLKLFRCKCK